MRINATTCRNPNLRNPKGGKGISEFTSTHHTTHREWGTWYGHHGQKEGSKYLFNDPGDFKKIIPATKSSIRCANCSATPKDSGSSNWAWYMCNECKVIICQFCRQGAKSPKAGGKSKTSSDTDNSKIGLYLVGFAAFIFFSMSPGILIFDIFSEDSLRFGDKWKQVLGIDVGLFVTMLAVAIGKIDKAFVYYLVICVLSSLTLIVMTLFFDANPLSGSY